MDNQLKSVKAVAMAVAGLAAVGVLLASASLFQISQLKKVGTPLFVAVDFEQGFYDARTAGVKINAGEWMMSKVENICASNKCIILNGGVVLGGNMIDINKIFRDEFHIKEVAQKPGLDSQEVQEAMKLIETTLGIARDEE